MEETTIASPTKVSFNYPSDWAHTQSVQNPLLAQQLTSDVFLREYQWERPFEGQDKEGRKTTLSVLLDEGVSARYSSLRMRLCCRAEEVPKSTLDPWNIVVESMPSPTVLQGPAHILREERDDTTVALLPELVVVFWIIPGKVTVPHSFTLGKLLPAKLGHVEEGSYVFFDKTHPLKPCRQSITASFTHSTLLYTSLEENGLAPIPTPTKLTPTLRHVACRVVHIFQTSPGRWSISLPTELFLLIFDHIAQHRTNPGWRRDLLSCSLVCRRWRCASDLLLRHFNEGLANAPLLSIVALGESLKMDPRRGLAIRTLDMERWEKKNLAPLSPSQRADYARAFLHILQTARNIRSLSIPSHKIDPNQRVELVTGLRGLRNLRSLRVYRLSWSGDAIWNGRQMASCIAGWPSLRSLENVGLMPGYVFKVDGLDPPKCALDTLRLSYVPMKDQLLSYITSSSSLKEIILTGVPGITNKGLRSLLLSVSRSLQKLRIAKPLFDRDEDEERALDAVIVEMVELKNLFIHGDVASMRMLERRTQAYKRNALGLLSILEVWILDVPEIVLAHGGARWAGWSIVDTGNPTTVT